MTTQTTLLIHGASGRMGQSLLQLLPACPGLQLVAATSRQPELLLLDDAEALAPSQLFAAPPFGLMIDFSLPEAFDGALAAALTRKAAFLSGTTGLSEAQRSELKAASAYIPVLWSANFSLGVAVLADLVERAARALPGWDLDIVESHHIHKKDAPSGTALLLGAAAERGGAEPHYASLRAGDIVGEHWLQFAGQGERIELAHRATRREIFARGALAVGEWLARQPEGHYTMRDWVASHSFAGA